MKHHRGQQWRKNNGITTIFIFQWALHWVSFSLRNWSISEIPQYTCPYHTMHHFVTEMWTSVHISVAKWYIVGYLSNALWDLWDKSIPCIFYPNIINASRVWTMSLLSLWNSTCQTLKQCDNSSSLYRGFVISWDLIEEALTDFWKGAQMR